KRFSRDWSSDVCSSDLEDRTRYTVRRELAARDTAAVIEAAAKWIAELDAGQADYEHHLLEGLWIYQTHNVVQLELLKKLLNAERAEERRGGRMVITRWL